MHFQIPKIQMLYIPIPTSSRMYVHCSQNVLVPGNQVQHWRAEVWSFALAFSTRALVVRGWILDCDIIFLFYESRGCHNPYNGVLPKKQSRIGTKTHGRVIPQVKQKKYSMVEDIYRVDMRLNDGTPLGVRCQLNIYGIASKCSCQINMWDFHGKNRIWMASE